MSFDKLRAACRIVSKDTWYHERFTDWQAKRDALVVLMHDLPALVELHKNRCSVPYSENPDITCYDPVPPIRLASACESTTNTLYGLSEIAAQFGNRASKTKLPSSFNEMRKKAQAGKLGPELPVALGDLQWYEKVRELRTEWAHYSNVFIGEHECEPLLVVRAYRPKDNREQFQSTLHCRIPDIIDWTSKALATIDNFAGYLLTTYVLPSFDLDATMIVPRYDGNGFPILKDRKFDGVETLTVREVLQRSSVIPRPEAAEATLVGGNPRGVVVDIDVGEHPIPLLRRQLEEHVEGVLQLRVRTRLRSRHQHGGCCGGVAPSARPKQGRRTPGRGRLRGDQREHGARQKELVVPDALGPDAESLPQVFAEVREVPRPAVLRLEEFVGLPTGLERHVVELLDRHAHARCLSVASQQKKESIPALIQVALHGVGRGELTARALGHRSLTLASLSAESFSPDHRTAQFCDREQTSPQDAQRNDPRDAMSVPAISSEDVEAVRM